MRQPWECPENCPNRKIGCQNPNTCEIYRLRVTRKAVIRSNRKIEPYSELKKTAAVIRGARNTGKRS